MSNEITRQPARGEVIGPVLTKTETGKLEKQAQQHYSRAQIGVILFAADLARLQNGNAHKVRGYGQFGKYCEAVFDGLTASNAQQIVRQGIVLLKLEEAGKLQLNEREQNLPGTTGLRELSNISKRFGEEAMLQTWDVAVASGKKVTSESVLAALGTFIQLEQGDTEEDRQLGEATEAAAEMEEDWDVDVTDKERELIDNIRDLSWNLPESLGEMQEAMKQLEAERSKHDNTQDQTWIDSKR